MDFKDLFIRSIPYIVIALVLVPLVWVRRRQAKKSKEISEILHERSE
jgi:hypothetical protein